MRGLLSFVATVALCSSTVMATNIKIDVQGPNGEPLVAVAPGGTVNYRIVGELSNDANLGLALIGLSLDFTGGNIDRATDEPTANPMYNFDYSEADANHKQGLTNPIGFGGTLLPVASHGDRVNIVQAGGCQNTIKNTAENAEFPTGSVITNVGVFGSPVVLATGSFTLPDTALAGNSYKLAAFDVFANVIKAGETGEVFYATEVAAVVPGTDLTVVSGDVPLAALTVANPVTGKSVPRTRNNTMRLTFGSTVAAPAAGNVLIQELLDGGLFGADLAATFTFTVEGGNVLRIRDNANTLVHRKWYAIRNSGGWAGVENFEVQYVTQMGDANNDGRTLFTDLGFINAGIPTDPAADNDRRDINGDGRVLFTDMGATNPRIPSDIVTKPTGH